MLACLLLLLPVLAVGACRAPASTSEGAQGVSDSADAGLLARSYILGERVRYRMTGTQENRDGTLSYEAESEGIVRRGEDGVFYEDTRWIRLQVGSEDVPLDPASLAFRQQLSLDPDFEMPFPDIRQVHPRLVGPIFDLMTFYVDLRPELRPEPLVVEGDRSYVAHGQPNSWADGTRVLIGEDAIDFVSTLERVEAELVLLRVRHVPPPEPAVRLPAEWMRVPVSDRPNNWVQVVQVTGGDQDLYVAAVGSETFDVVITVDRPSGRILRATMDNPVDVVERMCEDPDLTRCNEPSRYRIHRRIALDALP